MRLDTPVGVAARLAEISEDLAETGPHFEAKLRELNAQRARYELAMSIARRAAEGTVQDRTDAAIQAVEAEDRMFSKLAELEGVVEGIKARFRVLDRESSNLQSLLQRFREEAKLGGGF